MTHYAFALRYKNCNTADLIKFVRQRTGNLRRDRSRSWCMHKLKQLDREATFRFFDLPPELRNRIYEVLLYCNKERGIKLPAYPAVLRASRQVYNEACEILYDQSFFVTDSRGRWDPSSPGLFQHFFTLDHIGTYTIHHTVCPAYRLRIRRLTVYVELHPDGSKGFSNHFIPALLKYFGTDNPLKTLKMIYQRVRLPGFYPEWRPEDEFRQLRELPATTKVEFSEFSPELEKNVRALIGRPAE